MKRTVQQRLFSLGREDMQYNPSVSVGILNAIATKMPLAPSGPGSTIAYTDDGKLLVSYPIESEMMFVISPLGAVEWYVGEYGVTDSSIPIPTSKEEWASIEVFIGHSLGLHFS